MTEAWQKSSSPCMNRPVCKGQVNYEVNVGPAGHPWRVREKRAYCDACGHAYEVVPESLPDGIGRVHVAKSAARFHVTTGMDGGLRNAEMDVYERTLVSLGHTLDREMSREPQPDGTVYLKGGRMGVVATRREAEHIKAELERQLPHLEWRIEEV
jgi:hypothetical protein